MPKGSKKRKAIKRKQEMANNHSFSTDSAVPQGNEVGGDHDSSDHPLTEEDFSRRSAMETPPDPEPYSGPAHVFAVSKEASPVSEPEPTVSKEPSVVNEPDSALGKEASVVPESETTVSNGASVAPQNVLETGQNEAVSVALEVLDEPFTPSLVEDKSGEGNLYQEQAEVPESKPAVSEDISYIHVEQQNVSGLEKTEPTMGMTSKAPPFQDENKGDELSLYHGQNKLQQDISWDAPFAGSAYLLERRTSWWNCCGLLDFFGGARR